MKSKFLFLIAFVSLINFSEAQLIISSDTYSHTIYNESKGEWDILINQKKTNNVFGIMEDMSSFIHMSEDGTVLIYTITEWDYDEDGVVFTIFMEDDAKKEYSLVIDGKNEDMMIAWINSDKKQEANYYTISKIEDTTSSE